MLIFFIISIIIEYQKNYMTFIEVKINKLCAIKQAKKKRKECGYSNKVKLEVNTHLYSKIKIIYTISNKSIKNNAVKYWINKNSKQIIQNKSKQKWQNIMFKNITIKFKLIKNKYLDCFLFVNTKLKWSILKWILLLNTAKTITCKKKLKLIKQAFNRY